MTTPAVHKAADRRLVDYVVVLGYDARIPCVYSLLRCIGTI